MNFFKNTDYSEAEKNCDSCKHKEHSNFSLPLYYQRPIYISRPVSALNVFMGTLCALIFTLILVLNVAEIKPAVPFVKTLMGRNLTYLNILPPDRSWSIYDKDMPEFGIYTYRETWTDFFARNAELIIFRALYFLDLLAYSPQWVLTVFYTLLVPFYVFMKIFVIFYRYHEKVRRSYVRRY